MELMRVDTQRACDLIRERITTLEMAPGEPIDVQALAGELGVGLAAVREALWLLGHEGLVTLTPRHGIYVAEVNLPDLEQLSEMRLSLEGLSARLAAQRATPDDLVVLDAVRQEQATTLPEDGRRLFGLDFKFHQAIARAAHNCYLASTLERFFGLSQRLWYLALPKLGFLPAAVQAHLGVVEAVRVGDADLAEALMRRHVQSFYDQVREVLQAGE